MWNGVLTMDVFQSFLQLTVSQLFCRRVVAVIRSHESFLSIQYYWNSSWKKKHVWYDAQSLIENTGCKWLKDIKTMITLMILYMILIIFTRCWFVFEGWEHPGQDFLGGRLRSMVRTFSIVRAASQNEWPQIETDPNQTAISIWDHSNINIFFVGTLFH